MVMVSCNKAVMVIKLESISNFAMEEVEMMMMSGSILAVQGWGW